MTKYYSTECSLIKQLLQEAEEFVINPDDFGEPDSSGTGIRDLDFPSTPPPAQGGITQQLQPVNMPQPDASAPTAVVKTVINADLVLTHLSELKSIINNYEKRFGGDDIGVEDARVYISSFLNAMAYHSEKLQTFLNIEVEEPKQQEEPDMLLDDEDKPIAEPSLDLEAQAGSFPETPNIDTDFDLGTEEPKEDFPEGL